MKAPNIPTDNLYKFLAIFGLVLFLFSGYLLIDKVESMKESRSQLLENIEQSVDDFKAEEFKYENYAELMKNISKSIKEHNNKATTFVSNLFKPLIAVLLAGLFISIGGFLLWYYRTQKLLDTILKNEKNKYEYEKDVFQYKFKYEKEVELYRNVWKPLSSLRYGLSRLKTLQQKPNYLNEGDNMSKILETFNMDILPHKTKFLVTVEENEPFFTKEILESIEQLRDKINELLKESLFGKELKQIRGQVDIDKEINIVEIHDNINSSIRNLRDTIYDRISKVEIID